MDLGCKFPLKAWPVGFHDTGSVKYKITGYDVHHLELVNGKYIEVYEGQPNLLSREQIWNFKEIPCGNCMSCRLRYSRDWANRCMLELQSHDSAWFLTITYDDDHIPIAQSEDENGTLRVAGTLYKRDFQLFMKRLRKARPDDKIRFFACGEYGPETFRPHYHAIIYGLHLDDLRPSRWKSKKPGYEHCPYYESAFLEDVWHNQGHIVVTEVSWETCAYVARYITKKRKGPEAQFYSDLNIDPPFLLMSRRPGIARDYYDDHPEVMENDEIFIRTEKGGKKFRPPRYYDRLFDFEYPEESAARKAQKETAAKHARVLKLSQTDLSYIDMLRVQDEVLLAKTESLKRDMV